MTEANISGEPDWYGAEPKAPPRTWDFLLVVLLSLFMLILIPVLFFTALSGGIFNAACSNAVAACNPDFVSTGQLISIWAPAPIAIVAIIWSIVRVLRRRIAFHIALIGLILMFGAFLLGQFVIEVGIPDALG